MKNDRGMRVHPLAMMTMVTAIAVLLTVLVMRQPAALGTGQVPGATAPPAAANQAGQKTLYYSPMHPWIVQDHPGSCPICGMDLVEMPPEEQAVYEANHPAPA